MELSYSASSKQAVCTMNFEKGGIKFKDILKFVIGFNVIFMHFTWFDEF